MRERPQTMPETQSGTSAPRRRSNPTSALLPSRSDACRFREPPRHGLRSRPATSTTSGMRTGDESLPRDLPPSHRRVDRRLAATPLPIEAVETSRFNSTSWCVSTRCCQSATERCEWIEDQEIDHQLRKWVPAKVLKKRERVETEHERDIRERDRRSTARGSPAHAPAARRVHERLP